MSHEYGSPVDSYILSLELLKKKYNIARTYPSLWERGMPETFAGVYLITFQSFMSEFKHAQIDYSSFDGVDVA